MGTYIVVGLIFLLLALVVALASQRRAYVRDTEAIGKMESKLMQLTAERLKREHDARKRESEAAVERVLAKREQEFATSKSAPSVQAVSTKVDPVPDSRETTVEALPENERIIEELVRATTIPKDQDWSSSEIKQWLSQIRKEFDKDFKPISSLESARLTAAQVLAEDIGSKTEEGERAEFKVNLLDEGPRRYHVLFTFLNKYGFVSNEALRLLNTTQGPVVSGLSKADAELMKKMLEDAGAKVEVK